jgi:selenide, water dikinase
VDYQIPEIFDEVLMKNLVLIGGGHSHAIFLRRWGMNPLPGVNLILITDTISAAYSGMLPGYLGNIYSFAECHIDLPALAQFARAQLILATAIGLDLTKSQVLCHEHLPINFDWLSIDIGSTPAIINIPGAKEYTIAAKPVPQFLSAWQQFLQVMRQKPLDRPISLGIVGGGAGGVELALTLQVQLQTLFGATGIDVHLFHRHQELMNGYPVVARKRFQQVLIDRGIHLHLNESVTAVELAKNHVIHNSDDLINTPKIVYGRSGLSILCDRIIWVTQAAAPEWIAASGLATDAQGFISIDNNLQSISHPQIFAAGDIATIIHQPCPKAGVFAVHQGLPLFTNLRCMIAGKKLQPFQPQQRYLSLIGLGDRRAIATWGNICIGPSALLWRWKDGIDRRFMAQFKQLPKTHV